MVIAILVALGAAGTVFYLDSTRMGKIEDKLGQTRAQLGLGEVDSETMYHLRQIHTACMLYDNDNRIFPWAGEEAKAYEHFQLLVDSGYVKDPNWFVRPGSKTEKPAKLDRNGHFNLSEETCSYAYANVRRSSSSRSSRLLAADKHLVEQFGVKGIEVLYVGGDIDWVIAEGKSWEELTKRQLAK